MASKLGDMPTMKVRPAAVEAYARRADRKAAAGRAPSAPEIRVSVGTLDDPPTAVRNQSAVRPTARSIEGSRPEAVPVVAVSKDDLEWFLLESDAHAVLAMIDGHTSVEEIVAAVALPPQRVLDVLKELEAERVIALA